MQSQYSYMKSNAGRYDAAAERFFAPPVPRSTIAAEHRLEAPPPPIECPSMHDDLPLAAGAEADLKPVATNAGTRAVQTPARGLPTPSLRQSVRNPDTGIITPTSPVMTPALAVLPVDPRLPFTTPSVIEAAAPQATVTYRRVDQSDATRQHRLNPVPCYVAVPVRDIHTPSAAVSTGSASAVSVADTTGSRRHSIAATAGDADTGASQLGAWTPPAAPSSNMAPPSSRGDMLPAPSSNMAPPSSRGDMMPTAPSSNMAPPSSRGDMIAGSTYSLSRPPSMAPPTPPAQPTPSAVSVRSVTPVDTATTVSFRAIEPTAPVATSRRGSLAAQQPVGGTDAPAAASYVAVQPARQTYAIATQTLNTADVAVGTDDAAPPRHHDVWADASRVAHDRRYPNVALGSRVHHRRVAEPQLAAPTYYPFGTRDSSPAPSHDATSEQDSFSTRDAHRRAPLPAVLVEAEAYFERRLAPLGGQLAAPHTESTLALPGGAEDAVGEGDAYLAWRWRGDTTAPSHSPVRSEHLSRGASPPAPPSLVGGRASYHPRTDSQVSGFVFSTMHSGGGFGSEKPPLSPMVGTRLHTVPTPSSPSWGPTYVRRDDPPSFTSAVAAPRYEYLHQRGSASAFPTTTPAWPSPPSRAEHRRASEVGSPPPPAAPPTAGAARGTSTTAPQFGSPDAAIPAAALARLLQATARDDYSGARFDFADSVRARTPHAAPTASRQLSQRGVSVASDFSVAHSVQVESVRHSDDNADLEIAAHDDAEMSSIAAESSTLAPPPVATELPARGPQAAEAMSAVPARSAPESRITRPLERSSDTPQTPRRQELPPRKSTGVPLTIPRAQESTTAMAAPTSTTTSGRFRAPEPSAVRADSISMEQSSHPQSNRDVAARLTVAAMQQHRDDATSRAVPSSAVTVGPSDAAGRRSVSSIDAASGVLSTGPGSHRVLEQTMRRCELAEEHERRGVALMEDYERTELVSMAHRVRALLSSVWSPISVVSSPASRRNAAPPPRSFEF